MLISKIEGLARKWYLEGKRGTPEPGQTSIEWADNIIIVAKSHEEAEQMSIDLTIAIEALGFKVVPGTFICQSVAK